MPNISGAVSARKHQAMHRRAQAAESRAHERDQAAIFWMAQYETVLALLRPFSSIPPGFPDEPYCLVTGAKTGPYHFLESDLSAAKAFYHGTRPSAVASIVVELAESLAEAGVWPMVGSDNPHEDTLGRAIELVPAAKHAVARIIAQQEAGD